MVVLVLQPVVSLHSLPLCLLLVFLLVFLTPITFVYPLKELPPVQCLELLATPTPQNSQPLLPILQ